MIRKFLVLTFVSLSIVSYSQRTSSSPYSFFGIGEQFNANTVEQSSMGGIGVAFTSSSYFNFVNPAANADLLVATYAFGLLNNDLTVKDASGSQSSTSSNLRYISLGFPIGKIGAFSIGFQPISAVGYSLTNQGFDAVTGNLSEITQFSGNGGVNRLFGAFGYKLTDNINLGIEADFSFGNIENDIFNQSADVQLGTKYQQVANIRGGSIKFGGQFKKDIKNDLKLNLGATVKLSNSLSTEGDERLYSLTLSGNGIEIPRDTTFNVESSGEFITTITTNVGIGIGKETLWYTGVEYEFRNAISTSGILNRNSETFNFQNASRFSLGGYYIPKYNSLSNYLQRVTYRAGLRFENTGLLVNGTPNSNNFTSINDFGISFGLGLPLGNRISNLNLGFEYGIKGTTENNLIQENYFNVRASLSLNAIGNLAWFQKRKID